MNMKKGQKPHYIFEIVVLSVFAVSLLFIPENPSWVSLFLSRLATFIVSLYYFAQQGYIYDLENELTRIDREKNKEETKKAEEETNDR